MIRAVVGIASNVAPHTRVCQTLAALQDRFAELRISPVYRGPAVGSVGGDFLNLVAAFDTDECLDRVYAELRAIEAACGRDRMRTDTGVPMDIDLLLFGSMQREAAPQLPRRDILDQAFVLRPLAELLPGARHPGCGRTFAALWRAFDADVPALEAVTLEPGRDRGAQ